MAISSDIIDEIKLVTESPEETVALGIKVGHRLPPGSVVTFTGNLGSGKTTLIRGICRGLQVDQHVTSPTFTLINEYAGKMPVYHFDFYRLSNPMELHDIGIEEYFYGDGVCLIEWPEIVSDILPQNRIDINLTAHFAEGLENKRSIVIRSNNDKIDLDALR